MCSSKKRESRYEVMFYSSGLTPVSLNGALRHIVLKTLQRCWTQHVARFRPHSCNALQTFHSVRSSLKIVKFGADSATFRCQQSAAGQPKVQLVAHKVHLAFTFTSSHKKIRRCCSILCYMLRVFGWA